MSEESWFKRSLPWFEFLKVRASWGRTGRDNIKMWKWKEQYKMDLKGMQFGAESGKPGTSLIDVYKRQIICLLIVIAGHH